VRGHGGFTGVLRFEGVVKCEFREGTTRAVERPVVVESGILGARISETYTVASYFWSVTAAVAMSVMVGGEKHVVWTKEGTAEVESAEDAPPMATEPLGPFVVNVSCLWSAFAIARDDPACRTPRRNPQMEELLASCRELGEWCDSVEAALERVRITPFGVGQMEHVELPILPLVAGGEKMIESVAASFRTAWHAAGIVEEKRFASIGVLGAMAWQLRKNVDKVEQMLHDQLVAVIGTGRVTRNHLEEHFRLSLRDVLSEIHYCVRRDDESDPEGSLTVGEEGRGWMCVRSTPRRSLLQFAISASTNVHCEPVTRMHGVMRFQVGDEEQQPKAALSIAARHFGAVIVVMGRLEGERMMGQHAVLVRDRQTLEIPLLLEVLPTQKEFRDAISGLSREQRTFAEQYRAMQLSAATFGVLVIPVKPALERLLCVPRLTCTRELALTRSVLSLMLEYHISPDLLSARATGTMEELKKNTARMQTVIDEMLRSQPLVVVDPVVAVSGQLPWYRVFPESEVPEPSLPTPTAPVAKPRKTFGHRKKGNELEKEAFDRDWRRMMRLVKLLILGLPQSGKTTCAKQARLLYGNGFSAAEREEFRSICVQNAYADASPYFVKNSERILQSGFEPTDEDILRCCAKTRGVCEVEFALNGTSFRTVEVGPEITGKLLSSFEDVSAVIYVADLGNLEQLPDAIADFEQISNSKWFTHTNKILFLNKLDVFTTHSAAAFGLVFPDYKGVDLLDTPLEHVRTQFLKTAPANRPVFTHCTTVIDTKNFRLVFDAVKGKIFAIGDFQLISFRHYPHSLAAGWRLGFGRRSCRTTRTSSSAQGRDSHVNCYCSSSRQNSCSRQCCSGCSRRCRLSTYYRGCCCCCLFFRGYCDDFKCVRRGAGIERAVRSARQRVEETLDVAAVREESVACFGLLDCQSRGGALSLGSEAELHVVVVATHDYAKSIIRHVVEESRNPIEELEEDWRLVIEAISGV
jgi:hypothetical protein